MIQRILVANRGEIALRIFRTCRRLGIKTVAVYSEVDAGEPHATQADFGVLLPGQSATETYLNINAVLAAAIKAEADAVHPGYGFLAENAEFAAAVMDAGLTWIGPSPHSMREMGSKIRAKGLMEDSGVPTLPGRDITGLSPQEVTKAAETIGYPVLVKASAGGGGKGMRIVDDPSRLLESAEASAREAENAFGDGTIFLEKYLDAPRHIEIQVFADSHGNVVSLFERDCSIQRRHQKIIEESPSPAVSAELRAQMGDAAVRAAEAVSYLGAGTVEFLYQGGQFYFLEMNTRLQVEHPVTEMITGLDLVELQILVADGSPLPPSALQPSLEGHAIEARVYAEDPAHDFLPVTGRIHEFSFPPSVRVDSGVRAGSNVSVFYDPMLAKVIAHAPTRAAAIQLLASSLRSAKIHSATTNRDLLVRILESARFQTGDFDTHFLQEENFQDLATPLASALDEEWAARAAALADQALERSEARVLASLPTGWRNLGSQPQLRSFSGQTGEQGVSYAIVGETVKFSGTDRMRLIKCEPTRVELEYDSGVLEFDVARYGDLRFVDTDLNSVRLETVDRFPSSTADEPAGSLHSPMPGKVIRVDKSVGDSVSEGEILVVLEAMKMEHSIRSPYDGVVSSLEFSEGDQVEAGSVLAVVDPL